jgi:hypothetical protein
MVGQHGDIMVLTQPLKKNSQQVTCGWQLNKMWQNYANLVIFINDYVKTLALGSRPKQRACKVASQEGSPGVIPHALESVGKCEGMNPHTPKATLTLGNGLPVDSRIFKGDFRGQNSMAWRVPYIIEKILERRCVKWVRMTHLNI